MATGYCQDFLKSRKKNTQIPGVRARLEGLLEKYSDWTEKLGEEFRNIPRELHAVVAEFEATGRGYIWAASQQVAACVDRIHTAIERQRARIAAPMSEAEEKEFWRDTKDLLKGLTKLQELVGALRKAISGRREVEDTNAMRTLEQDCGEWCAKIVQFAKNVENSRGSSSERIRDVQDAAETYRRQLTRMDNAIVQNTASDFVSIHDEADKEYRVRLDDVKATITIQTVVVDAVLFTHCMPFMLPSEASAEAIEIQRIVNDIQRESLTLAARIESHSGDPHARCDTLPEMEIPDYARLGDTDKEHDQFRVVVDVMLMMLDTRGPNGTMDRKQLQQAVEMLASHRAVAGLATTSLWNKLDRLVGRNLVRKFPGVKTKATPNAADEYRLSIPAQRKFACYAAAVRAEFNDIEALDRAADSAD